MPYSATVMDHFLHPRREGVLPATPVPGSSFGEGRAGSPEAGRWMQVQLRLDSAQRILDARFRTFSCAPAVAAGSYLCEWAVGRTAGEARRLDPISLERELGGLPPHRRSCAALAVAALWSALDAALSDHPPQETEP